MKVAVIDIGTNSVLLTIAERAGREIKNVVELSRITRLGKGMGEEQLIREEHIEATLNALKEFADKIHNKGVEKVKYIATEAIRKAKNNDYVLRRLSSVSLSEIEVIDGPEEAFLSFYSVSYMNPAKEISVVDIGGGSTEITMGRDQNIQFAKSLPVGAVTLYERFFSDDEYRRDSVLKANGYINRLLEESVPPQLIKTFTSVYLTGGTITNLVSILEGRGEYNADLIENRTVSIREIKGVFDTISQIRRDERAKITGIEAERADILPAGILIAKSILNYFRKDVVRVSARGLRWGVIFKMDEEGT